MAAPPVVTPAEVPYRLPEPPSAAYLASQVWTADRVQAELVREDRHWPRYEFVDGELLVTAAPNIAHQRLLAELFRLLDPYARTVAGYEVLWSPADVRLDDENTLQPDLFVIDRGVSGRAYRAWSELTRLHLAVEVLSPSSLKHDRTRKRGLYARWRIPVYWVVDPWARTFEVTTPDDTMRPKVVADEAVWHPAGTPTALSVDVPAYFERVLGAKDDPNAAVVADAS